MSLSRRHFIHALGAAGTVAGLGRDAFAQTSLPQTGSANPGAFMAHWNNPPREFSQAPFWFWNDKLAEAETARQLQDFCDHGVYGFVIHPRAGLPLDTGWMSDNMIRHMRFAIEEAARKDMWVVLYDEGMYPSGSASGQVVAEDRRYRPRGLFAVDLDEAKPREKSQGFLINESGEPELEEDQNRIAVVKRQSDGHRIAILDRYIQPGYALIRGLHFTDDDPPRRANRREVPENMPELGDILNPESVQCFIRLVYQRYYDEFAPHFGNTIKAVFTDEPSFFGKRAERGAVAGNAETLRFVNDWLGYDFTPHLAALWFDDEPDAEKHRADYERALEARLEQTFYQPISDWCAKHQVALTGHPADPDDIGHLRHFQMPGQDIVWRYIEPGKASALEGAQSTQAKCASSSMIHMKRRRNSNEYCGAYGHDFTFREMKWLANWLIVRGCNLLYPHAFYYSVRGPRVDERPPDVGPNNVWWDEFKPFADATSRLCWLNTDSRHVCDVAVLGLNDYLPWRSPKACFQHQIDFNYLEARHLWEDAEIREDGIHLAGMNYKALVAEFDPPEPAQAALKPFEQAGRLIRWSPNEGEAKLLASLDRLIQRDVKTSSACDDLRVRHIVKDGRDACMLFNEGERELSAEISFSVNGDYELLKIDADQKRPFKNGGRLTLDPHEMIVALSV